ncbi:MAG TPA: TonB-dependent receptor, partial [Bryobacteraceae bacterium]|nr:TonB-dependent receptor [Bryobacteraceae bacterium]
GQITYIDAGGDSYYHSLQTRMRKRFSDGLLFGVAYTFGKSIDTQSVDPVQASSGGGLSTINARTPTDVRNWRSERGRSDFDRTHVFTSNFVYDLPFGRRGSGFTKAVLGGWSLNGIYTAMSGEPFSVRSGVRTSNNSHESRAAIVGEAPEVRLQEKAGVLGPVVFGPDAVCSTAVTTNCFTTPEPGSNGAGRNIFTAPGYWNTDLSVVKRFVVTERVTVQFRTEAFNVFNHANFDNPRDASSSSTAINSTLFGQSCCSTVAPASTQAIIQTGESARVVQFALKLDF